MNLRTFCWLILCSILSFQGKAQKNLDSLSSALNSISGTEKNDVLNTLGFEYAYKDLEKAYQFSLQAYQHAIKIDYPKGRASALINLGYSHMDRGHNDSARFYFEEAITYSNKEVLNQKLGDAQKAYGNFIKNLGEIDNAISQYKGAVKAYQLANYKIGEASALNNIGVALRQSSNYQEAIKYTIDAMKINEELGENKKVALNLMNIAMNYIDQRDEQFAIKYMDDAFKIQELQEDLRLFGIYNNRMGLIAEYQKDYEKAIKYHSKEIELTIKRGKSHAKSLHNLANTYRQSGDIPMSLQLADSALAMKKDLGWSVSSIYTLNLLSDIYLELEEYQKSIDVSLEALKLSREFNVKERERKTLGDLSEGYAAAGKHDLAWDIRMQYEHLEDSLFNLQKSQQQESLLALYETEKQQQQLALQEATIALTEETNTKLMIAIGSISLILIGIFLAYRNKTKTNKLLITQKEAIAQRDKEKEVLLKEIHHRVKNNLQIISSILNIQSRKLEDDSAKKAVKEGQSRIKSMSLIHEKLYGSNELSIVNMKEYIEDLSQFLFSTYKTKANVISKIEAEEFSLDIDKAIPIGLILNELISNSLKYAFNEQDEGQLQVVFKQNKDKLELQVSDTGKGLPENFEEMKNMGMRLVSSLTEQIEGVLDVKSDLGTSFTITFDDKKLNIA